MQNKENEHVYIYLDQNIIDSLVKTSSDSFAEFMSSNEQYNIIYSKITIDEISRIKEPEYRDKYLDVLEKYKAIYFWVDDNELAQFSNKSSYELYEEFNSPDNVVFDKVQKSLLDFSHKMSGGKKGIPIEDITASQLNSFSELMKLLEDQIELLSDQSPIEKSILKNYPKLVTKNFENLMNELNKTIKKHNPNTENMSGVKDFRTLLELEPIELNNIKPPNIIEKIWDRMKLQLEAKDIKLEFTDLFGDGMSRFYQNQKFTMMMKVNGIYNLLNTIGYFPDKNIEKDRKFISFVSDQQHAGMAIYSNVLLTRDKRFMKKTEAVYEHLKIGTKIELI